MKSFDVETRVSKAIELFDSGYNCCQAVVIAYHDVVGIPLDIAKNMSLSFGGGIGRMRETCGTVTGMALVAGFKYPACDENRKDAADKNAAIVKKMLKMFKEEHQTLSCKELLTNIAKQDTPKDESSKPLQKKKGRPCVKFVASSAQIVGQMLKGELE